MKTLKQYIPIDSRHKLLFTSHYPEGMVFTDVGVLLANAIESSLLDRHLPMIADEAIEKIVSENVKHDLEIGDYIAIRNIGILFEPALHLDLHAKFSAWLKSYTLIVECLEGIIQNGCFYLAGAIDQHYSINLSDISHNIHYDEI